MKKSILLLLSAAAIYPATAQRLYSCAATTPEKKAASGHKLAVAEHLRIVSTFPTIHAEMHTAFLNSSKDSLITDPILYIPLKYSNSISEKRNRWQTLRPL